MPRSEHIKSLTYSLAGAIIKIVMSTLIVGVAFCFVMRYIIQAFSTAFVLVVFFELTIFGYLKLLLPKIKKLERKKMQILELILATPGIFIIIILPLLSSYLINPYALKTIQSLLAFVLGVVCFFLVQAIYFIITFHNLVVQTTIKEKKLQILALQSELKALKVQLNPHFLFNTLNTVAELVHIDPSKAETIIEKLATILRYILTKSEAVFVPLVRELKLVWDYLDIEYARFDSKLKIEKCVQDAALDIPVPSLILQPVVENVIQHGASENGEIYLRVEALLENGSLEIKVIDRGPGIKNKIIEKRENHFGLYNINQRLKGIYGRDFALRIIDNYPQGSVVIYTIPYRE